CRTYRSHGCSANLLSPHVFGRDVRKTLKRLRQGQQHLRVAAAFVCYTLDRCAGFNLGPTRTCTPDQPCKPPGQQQRAPPWTTKRHTLPDILEPDMKPIVPGLRRLHADPSRVSLRVCAPIVTGFFKI